MRLYVPGKPGADDDATDGKTPAEVPRPTRVCDCGGGAACETLTPSGWVQSTMR